MAERLTIIDRNGDWYTIELFEDDQFFAMRVYRGVQVGYARCIVKEGHVELADIKINGRLEHNKFYLLMHFAQVVAILTTYIFKLLFRAGGNDAPETPSVSFWWNCS